MAAKRSIDDGLPETYCEGFHDPEAVRKMRYRSMPHFGKVSIVSFGASGLGCMHTAGQGTGLKGAAAGEGSTDAWFAEDSAEDKAAARELVLMCLKAGVNLFDTSHWYGQGRSERMLGHALEGVPRRAYYINSKIGRYDKDPLGMFDFSYEKTYQVPANHCRDALPTPAQRRGGAVSTRAPSCLAGSARHAAEVEARLRRLDAGTARHIASRHRPPRRCAGLTPRTCAGARPRVRAFSRRDHRADSSRARPAEARGEDTAGWDDGVPARAAEGDLRASARARSHNQAVYRRSD